MPNQKITSLPKSVKQNISAGLRGINETVDIWLEDDFKAEMPDVYGIYAIAQRLVRRFTTPRGLFPWWPNDGLDIRQYLLSKVPIWRIKSDLEAEAVKDEQIEGIIASPVYSPDFKSFDIFITIVTIDGQNFSFTMRADEASVRLIALQNSQGTLG